jgi:hypothetical protein
LLGALVGMPDAIADTAHLMARKQKRESRRCGPTSLQGPTRCGTTRRHLSRVAPPPNSATSPRDHKFNSWALAGGGTHPNHSKMRTK